MTTLIVIRERARQLLADTEADVWSDADLDEALNQALEIYSRERPYQDVAAVAITAPAAVPAEVVIPADTVVTVDGEWVIGRRDTLKELDLSVLANTLIDVTDVWCPFTAADPEDPPNERAFSYWSSLQTLYLSGYEPDTGETARVFYTRLHTLDINATSVPQRDHGLLALGGAAYAANSRAVDIAERRGAVDVLVTQQVRAWGAAQLRRFMSELSKSASMDVAGGPVEVGQLDRYVGDWS